MKTAIVAIALLATGATPCDPTRAPPLQDYIADAGPRDSSTASLRDGGAGDEQEGQGQWTQAIGGDAGACPVGGCNPGYSCAIDPLGGYACKQNCAKSSDCGDPLNTCCAFGGTGYTVCAPVSWGTDCNCATASDCSNIPGKPACAPWVDTTPSGSDDDTVDSKTMVCKPNDAKAWDGCNSGTNSCCPSDYNCWGDQVGNKYCARPCLTDSNCRNSKANADRACCILESKGATCNTCSTDPCVDPFVDAGTDWGGCGPCP